MTYDDGPVPVHIATSDIQLGPAAAPPRRYGATLRSFTLTANDPVQQVLPLNGKRCRAWAQAQSSPVTLYTDQSDARTTYATLTAQTVIRPDGGGYGSGVVAAPTAGTTIASIPAANLPAGRYLLRVNAGFGGNAETTTDFNFDLVGSAGNLIASRLMVTAASNNVRNWIFDNIAIDGASILKLIAHSTASASAVYVGDITATPIALPPPANGGIIVPASNTAWTPLPTGDPIWATSAGIVSGGNPVTVSVISIIEE